MTDVSRSPSGLPPVDARWGGFAPGGSYLLVGRAGAGRSALALQTVRAAVETGERALVISPREPGELVEVAIGIGLDLASAHRDGRLRLLRIPSAADLAARGAEGLAKSYRDLSRLVADDRPSRVVIEDFTPLVQFDTFDRFRAAFEQLAGDLEAQGVTLVVGLGEPGNEASRRLLEVVEEVVSGSVHLGPDGQLSLRGGPPSSDGGPAGPAPAQPEDVSGEDADGPAAPPAQGGPAERSPSTDEPGSVESDALEAEANVLEVETAALEVDPPAPTTTERTDAPAPSADPFALEPVGADGDGFSTSFSTAAESSGDSSAVSEPDPPTPSPEPSSAAPDAPLAMGDGAPPPTDVIPPPAAAPSLLAPTGDAFGFDPAETIIDQGYLADSRGAEGSRPAALAAPAAPPAPAQSAVAPPSFAPLGGAPAPDPGAAFRSALEDAFAARASGAPFVVVALRMEPSAPQAAHFPVVEDALRSGLGSDDKLLVNAARKRAIVLLTDADEGRSRALFGALQTHLQGALGQQAEAVRQAIGAVTIADGRPFETAADLTAYAYDG